MAEPIEIPFGFWTQIGSKNHVLDKVQIPSWERAIVRRGKARSIATYMNAVP